MRNYDCMDSKPLICLQSMHVGQLAAHAILGPTTRPNFIWLSAYISRFHFSFIRGPPRVDISSTSRSNSTNIPEIGLQCQGVNLLFCLLLLLLKFFSIIKYVLVVQWTRFHYSHLNGHIILLQCHIIWIPKLPKYHIIHFFFIFRDIKS